MVQEPLFRNPQAWEKFVTKYDYPLLSEIGLDGIKEVHVDIVDTPKSITALYQQVDTEFEALRAARRVQLIAQGWSGDALEKKLPFSGPSYGVIAEFDRSTGMIRGVERKGDTMVVRAFHTNYATRQFAGIPENRAMVDSTTAYDLAHLAVLGSCSLTRSYEARILFGTKHRPGEIIDKFEELVPQGLSIIYDDPNTDGGIFYKTLLREIEGETTLTEADLAATRPFMMEIGPSWGDFALVYDVRLKEEADARARIGREDEHSAFTWRTAIQVAELNKYDLNPTSFHILQRAGLHK